MRRLMTHLAQFSSFSTQGELLCTQGLAYLLENSDARLKFADYISKRAGIPLSADATWRAEVCQSDGGRPDLEACTPDGKLAAKIEAKLGAAFGEGQLTSYVSDLNCRSGDGLLLVLVPRHREKEVAASVSSAFALAGDGPWRPGDRSDSAVAVISWEEILDALATVSSEPFAGDLAQFQAMYRVLKGYDIEAITTDADLLAWREREGAWVNRADRVTRYLTRQSNVLPMGEEWDSDGNRYQRRYICPWSGIDQPCFSVGVRDPFAGHTTPIWLRFHHGTPKFSVIRDRLAASGISQQPVESDGHIWIPLNVPHGVEGELQIDSLVANAEDVVRFAYQALP